jgi:hypothetical protein
MIKPVFEFFEIIAEELCSEPSRIITSISLQANKEVSTLLDDLQAELNVGTSEEAMDVAVRKLQDHFAIKSAEMPFSYDANTGRFEAVDLTFLQFVRQMSNIRSVGKRSRNFECTVAERLGLRATGHIHRVGHPRDTKKTKKAFNAHLRLLGFRFPVLLGSEKDGGLDILWMLPFGSLPHIPFVAIQCKNGVFNVEEADKSLGAGRRSLSQHGGLQADIHVPCVLFNDYISAESVSKKAMNFVPLGLTDLATISTRVSVVTL